MPFLKELREVSLHGDLPNVVLHTVRAAALETRVMVNTWSVG